MQELLQFSKVSEECTVAKSVNKKLSAKLKVPSLTVFNKIIIIITFIIIIIIITIIIIIIIIKFIIIIILVIIIIFVIITICSHKDMEIQNRAVEEELRGLKMRGGGGGGGGVANGDGKQLLRLQEQISHKINELYEMNDQLAEHLQTFV